MARVGITERVLEAIADNHALDTLPLNQGGGGGGGVGGDLSFNLIIL